MSYTFGKTYKLVWANKGKNLCLDCLNSSICDVYKIRTKNKSLAGGHVVKCELFNVMLNENNSENFIERENTMHEEKHNCTCSIDNKKICPDCCHRFFNRTKPNKDEQPEPKKSQAYKQTAGKTKVSYVPPALIEYVGRVRQNSIEGDYPDPEGWKNVPQNDFIDAIGRHWLEIVRHGPGAIDEKSGSPHAAHIACNCGFLLEHFDIQKAILGDQDKN